MLEQLCSDDTDNILAIIRDIMNDSPSLSRRDILRIVMAKGHGTFNVERVERLLSQEIRVHRATSSA
jgi:hypothetical protein